MNPTQDQITKTDGQYDTPPGVGGRIDTRTGQLLGPITSAQLQPTSPATIPSTPASTSLTGLSGYLGSFGDSFTKSLAADAAAAKEAYTNSGNAFADALMSGTNEAALTDKAYSTSVDPLSKELDSLNSQLLAEQTGTRHQIAALQQNPQGLETGALNGAVAKIQKDSLSRQADIAVLISAKSGQMDTARAIADRAVAAQVDDEKNKITALQTIYDENKDLFTTDEQRQFETAQADRNRTLDLQTQQQMAKYNEVIKQNDPLYQAQLTKARNDAAASAPEGGAYNGDFAATIDLIANQGTTNTQRAQLKNQLQTFIANKDYGSAYAAVSAATGAGLKGAAATTFQQQQNSVGVLDSLRTAIQNYANAGGNTNIFKGSADNIQTKIGKLYTDPKYASLATQLDAAFQAYRLQMTGAAFGPQESAQYASILPSKGNTIDLNLAKLNGAQAYLNSSVESSIRSVVGQGGIYIKQYAEGAQPAAQPAPADDEFSQWLTDNGLL